MSKERKKIKDTKLGQWLSEKAPEVLGVVGDLLPDSGGLGVVKNLLRRLRFLLKKLLLQLMLRLHTKSK